LTIRPLVELKEYVKGQIQEEKAVFRVGNKRNKNGWQQKTINTTLGKGSATKGLVTKCN
jgi:hypothetical protein